MALVQIDGRAVEYVVVGAGEAVLLCGPGWRGGRWTPGRSAAFPSFPTAIRSWRSTSAASARAPGRPGRLRRSPVSRDTLALMDALHIPSAHVLGFAIGAVTCPGGRAPAADPVRSLVLAAAGGGAVCRPRGPRVVPGGRRA